jgi:anti-anti-sigma regulatory factor
VQSLLGEGRDQILVNLERVPAIGERGLSEIVSAAAVTNLKGGRFKLTRLNQTVLETIRKAQLLTYLDVFEVESQAIDSFTPGSSRISSREISA